MLKVFLSSTGKDLEEFRQRAKRAIDAIDGYHCEWMESFGARAASALDFCRARVEESDIYVGIIGLQYGSSVPDGSKSFTEVEYDAARKCLKPMLLFCTPETFAVPGHLRESDDDFKRQRSFREKVFRENVCATFSTSAELAERITQSIHNLQQRGVSGSASIHSIERPTPPEPWFVHPYPLQKNFAGRRQERAALTDWLTSGTHSLLGVTAIGGMGKSALAWVWTRQDVLGQQLSDQANSPDDRSAAVDPLSRPSGVLWWSFYETGATFPSSLDALIRYGSDPSVDPTAIRSVSEKVDIALRILSRQRLLLILDGFERELVAYAGLNAPYLSDASVAAEAGVSLRSCIDPHTQGFLKRSVARPLMSRIPLTTRLFPEELENSAGARRYELTAMDPEDALLFFRAQGIRAAHADVYALGDRYGYHPLAVRLLAARG